LLKKVFKNLLKGEIINRISKLTLVRIISTPLALIVNILLFRAIGSEQYGIFVYVNSWLLLLSVCSRFGFSTMLIRYLSRFATLKEIGKMKSLFIYAYGFTMITSLIIGICGSVIFYFNPQIFPIYNKTFLVGLLFTLPVISIALLQQSTLVGLKQVVISDIPINIFRNVILVTIFGLLYLFHKEISASLTMFIVGIIYASVVIINFIIISRFLDLDLMKKTKKIQESMSWATLSKPFFFISGSQIINQRADVIILGFFTPPGQLAVYAAVSRLIPLIGFVSGITNSVIKPYISSFHAVGDKSEIQKVVFRMSIISFVATILTSIFLVVLGKWILGLFGEEIVAGYILLIILALGKVISILTGPVAILLSMTDHAGLASKSELASNIFYIILCFLLIPKYGIIGAAIGTATAWVFRNLLMTFFVLTKLKINPSVFNIIEGKKLIAKQ